MNATTRLRGGWRSAARERWEHGLGVRRRPLGGTSIESWGFRTEDGRCGTLLETEHVDIEAVDPARRGRVVDAFAQICRSLEQPLRVIVQVRPFEIASMPAERLGREGQLEAAMKDHWRQQLQSEPAFRRTILLVPVVEGRFQENVIRASTALATAVASAGIRASTAEEAAWSNLLDTRSNQDWEEHRSWARIGDTWVRGFVLTRLPGRAVRAGWLTPLLTVKASCDIAIQLSPLQPLEAITLLGRR
ncbi:MAG TPA: hypothetical protein VE219_06610, partial [Candidatus Sulfotelmatobacter sp.]|nr:hypothetical protein [Candidatus Sulfotelmatobacter sp.]